MFSYHDQTLELVFHALLEHLFAACGDVSNTGLKSFSMFPTLGKAGVIISENRYHFIIKVSIFGKISFVQSFI